MKFSLLFKSSLASVFAFALISSNKAYAQDSSSAACEMWLCMPGSRIDSLLAGSNPIGAGCVSPYFSNYIWRVANPFQSAMTNFENCIENDYYDRFPEMDIRSDVDRPGFFGGSWEKYEVEVYENGRKRGEFSFRHHENRVFTVPEDRRRPAVDRVRRSGDFSNLFPF